MNFQDNRIHEDDKRNLIIFFVACVAVFLLYDIFIHQPQMEQMEAARKQAAEEQTIAPQTNANAIDTTSVLDRKMALAKSNRITIDTDTVKGSLSTKGGRIDDLSFKHYMTEAGGDEPVTFLSPVRTAHPYFGEFGWLAGQGQSGIRLPDSKTNWQVIGNRVLTSENPVTLQWNNGQGLRFEKTIALDDNYMFTVTQKVTNNRQGAVTLFPYGLIARDGLPEYLDGMFILHEGPIGFAADELFEIDYSDLDDGEKQSVQSDKGWIGITDKYWLSALMPAADNSQDITFRFAGKSIAKDKTRYQTDMMGTALIIDSGVTQSVTMHYFAGPKVVDVLEGYKDTLNVPRFDLAVDFGIFYFLTRPFYEVLTFIEGLVGNFAIALLIFTVLIKACVFPLAQKSYRSFARMRKVSPQMMELREKFGDDRVKLQQEIFELYKRENVNPMAGCFPILLQIPIFFALYKVFYVAIDMRHTPFWGWIDDMAAKDPTNLFEAFGLLPWDAPSWMIIGAWPIIMGATMALQQRLNPPAQDPIQQKVMMILPIWITFILASFPAGLVIYWSWSNTLSIVQQYILLRQEGVKVNIFTRTRVDTKADQDDAVIESEPIEKKVEKPKTVTPKKRKKKK